MDRPPDEPPREDDWLREEWLDEPTEEASSSSRRPARPAEPGLRGPDRRILALVAAAALVLAVILAFVLGGDGDDQAVPTAPTATSPQTETGTATAEEPSQVVPEGAALSEGDSGRRVRQLQRALAALGYEVTPDGEYGPATSEAVAAFQRDADLEADGVAGAETIAAVNEALATEG